MYYPDLIGDWVEGKTYYGYSVDFSTFSVPYSLTVNGEELKMKSKGENIYFGDRIEEAVYFIPCCWRLFCANIEENNQKITAGFKCFFSCETYTRFLRPGYSDNSCCFVFGYELQEYTELEELKEWFIPRKLAEVISQFICIFNDTDILQTSIVEYDRYGFVDQEKIRKDELAKYLTKKKITEALSKIKSENMTKIKERIFKPRFLIGCQ